MFMLIHGTGDGEYIFDIVVQIYRSGVTNT